MEDVSNFEKLGESRTCMTMAGTPPKVPICLPFDQLERALGVEVVHHHELPAGGQVGDHDRVAAGGVEERDRQQEGRLRLLAHRRQGSCRSGWRRGC